MKNLIFVLSILFLASCGQTPQEPTGSLGSNDGHFDSISVPKDKVSDSESKPFSNPAYMYGSDFGNYFQSIYERGQYETMLSFTSSESIKEHGEEKILNHYKSMEFGFDLGGLKSQTTSSDTTTLNYKAEILATDVMIRLDVVLENDTCKIVLPSDLGLFPGYSLKKIPS